MTRLYAALGLGIAAVLLAVMAGVAAALLQVPAAFVFVSFSLASSAAAGGFMLVEGIAERRRKSPR